MSKKTNFPFIILIAIILLSLIYTTIDSIIPSNYSEYTLPITITIPFLLIATYILNSKIWYLWIILPALLTFLPLFDIAWGYLFVFASTAPIYIWTRLNKNNQYNLHYIGNIDIPIFILFTYVIYIALTNPIGLGLNFEGDYLAGHAYFSFLGCFIAYICLSTLKTNPTQFYKILHISLYFIGINKLLHCILALLSHDNSDTSVLAEQDMNPGIAFRGIATFLLSLIIIKFDLKNIVKKLYPTILLILCLLLIMYSASRATGIYPLFIFLIISLIYKRFTTIILSLFIGILSIFAISAFNLGERLPLSFQRIISIIPIIQIDERAALSAQDSTNWRLDMWKYALDDRYNFIQDKVWGDGFSRDKKHYFTAVYSKVYNLKSFARSNEAFRSDNDMYLAGWHNGPISTIHTMGYVGFTLYLIITSIGIIYAIKTMIIYKHHKYRLSILYYSFLYIYLSFQFIAVVGVVAQIPQQIFHLLIIKLLFCFAIKEGLYIPRATRREYIPMICRQANSEPT